MQIMKIKSGLVEYFFENFLVLFAIQSLWILNGNVGLYILVFVSLTLHLISDFLVWANLIWICLEQHEIERMQWISKSVSCLLQPLKRTGRFKEYKSQTLLICLSQWRRGEPTASDRIVLNLCKSDFQLWLPDSF